MKHYWLLLVLIASPGQAGAEVTGRPAIQRFVPEAETVFGLEKPDFEDIWQIEVLPEGVFFLALNNLYAFDPETGRTRHWHHPGRFGAMARIDGEVIVQFRGEGLRALRGDEFVPVSGSAGLRWRCCSGWRSGPGCGRGSGVWKPSAGGWPGRCASAPKRWWWPIASCDRWPRSTN